MDADDLKQHDIQSTYTATLGPLTLTFHVSVGAYVILDIVGPDITKRVTVSGEAIDALWHTLSSVNSDIDDWNS